ncbi:tripartite tricarboxylate transporter TctB family protein [Pseudoroseomonas cervicalis]|uniref:tripartite tricarboxylate transporter TctB family protein n=1 Tax=Teichococcus cervicalis TaxID=204525 RepID=UPI0022F15D1D|nr:tripartite tricarboxylate transporter TctB family protein [Pseudoroseomonas cervicalis]WBV44769.1 tripartite tricarboxylate transporter TctB family protein [Pseudoroseomonas cervicalis]
MRVNDTLLGVVLLLLGGAVLGATFSFPSFPGQDYGPALFPRLLAGGMALCGLMLLPRGLAARRRGEAWLQPADWARRPVTLISFLLIPLAALAYLLLAEPLGFLPVAFLLLLGLFLWFGERWWRALPVALLATWLVHWFFAGLMRVPLPRGPLPDLFL